MELKYGVPKYIDGIRNPEWDKRERKANTSRNYAYQAKWRATHKERVKEYTRKWRAQKSKEWLRTHARESRRKWAAKNPDKYYRGMRCWNLRHNYGITLEQYEQMLKAQKRECAICGRKHVQKPRKRLQPDHNHATGKLRALLCSSCNVCISRAYDNPDILRKAAEYIEYHRN